MQRNQRIALLCQEVAKWMDATAKAITNSDLDSSFYSSQCESK